VLGLCLLKRALRRGLAKSDGSRPIIPMTFGFWVFFGWVIFRYCLNPVMPNAGGFGENVTGFRPYMSYAICFGLVITLGYFIQSRSDLSKMIRWLAWISVLFILLLVPLMFTRSPAVANVLQYLGLYVIAYDNGIFRFVVLPGFGIIIATLALLPALFPLGRKYRIAAFATGVAAVILGGNRGSLLMLFAILCVIPLLKMHFARFAAILTATGMCLVTFHYVGESGLVHNSGVLRILAVASPRVAQETGADYNVEWRKIRWSRAIEEIRNDPWLGRGYGGVQNAFLWSNWADFEEASMEIDLATGGVHNGYLACALAFGIPAALLFVLILAWAIWRNAKLAMRAGGRDPSLKELHAFVCANLIAYALAIYIGTDLNNPILWFFLALGILSERLRHAEVLPTAAFMEPSFQGRRSAVPA
jgi:O-antigen ligase